MTLREAKQIIRQWVRTHFDDQKLAEVYAFNRDGRMCYSNPCGCLLGVTGARRLHVGCGDTFSTALPVPSHYVGLKATELGLLAEMAYLALGKRGSWLSGAYGDEQLRRVRLSAILRWEMHRRERERALADPEPEYPLTCGDDEPEEIDQVPYDQAVCSES